MLKRSLLYILVIATMILSACAPAAVPTTAPEAPKATEAAPVATEASRIVAMSFCEPRS